MPKTEQKAIFEIDHIRRYSEIIVKLCLQKQLYYENGNIEMSGMINKLIESYKILTDISRKLPFQKIKLYIN